MIRILEEDGMLNHVEKYNYILNINDVFLSFICERGYNSIK